MRHRIQSKKLNRSSKHRKALFKNLAKDLFLLGEIETTEAKAKVIRPIAEKLLSRAKKQNLQARKMIHRYFNDKKVTTHLLDRLAPQLDNRTSGFLRIKRVRVRRGDDAMMAKISFVDRIVPVEPEIKPVAKVTKE